MNSPPLATPTGPNATSAASAIPAGFIRVESKLEGITVYAPAPRVDKLADARSFKCPNCGATTAFDPRVGSMTCSNCGSVYAIQAQTVGRRANEFEFTLDTVNSTPRGWGLTRRDLHCENCGANISVAPTELSTTCPFCGSNRVAARTAVPDAFRPRVLIPFKTARDACTQLARAWLKRGWMYPSDLVHAARGAQFTGIYLPFWTFSARVNAAWRAEVGREKREQYFDVGEMKFKTRTRLEWNWEQGQVALPFDDELQTGASHINGRLLKRLAPYDLNALVTYDPGYLAGWRAQSYEISLNDAWDAARTRMREIARDACDEQIDSRHVRNFSMNAVFDDEAWRLILLPAFLATYRFADKTYQIVINGQTGKVAGDKPVAWTKVWAIVGALVLPGVLLAGLALAFGMLRYQSGGLFLLGGVVFVVGAIVAVVLLQQAQRGGEA
ncbi:MAG: TFIIB-type zinc ribbon-containing protein [Chloroflexi bacterium]|nr:TFIIB-type zinc ribbon-containing protein [Chloroflexota bacterium]